MDQQDDSPKSSEEKTPSKVGESDPGMASAPAAGDGAGGTTNLIRKEALQAVSSNDAIRDLLVVTRRRGWLTMAGVGFVILAILIYAIFGRIPVKVKGAGMLVAGSDLYLVDVSSAGRLIDIHVKVGDRVEEGQLVAEMSSRDLDRQLESLSQRLILLEEQNTVLSTVEGSQLEFSQATLERSITSLEQEITSSNTLHGLKKDQLTAQKELIKKGYISQNTLISTMQEVTQLEQSMLKSQASLKESRQSHETTVGSVKQSRAARADEINQTRAQIAELESKRDTQLMVVSDVAGVVVGVRQDRGSVLDAGAPLFEIQEGASTKGTLSSIAYLSLKTGKRAAPGMLAEVSPTIAKRSRFGFIKGTVSSVEEYVASEEQLETVFANESIVQEIRQGLGPVIRVGIEMETDAATPSGFRWSTNQGYPVRLTAGTEITIEVVVEERRPISYVIPWLRRQLGE